MKKVHTYTFSLCIFPVLFLALAPPWYRPRKTPLTERKVDKGGEVCGDRSCIKVSLCVFLQHDRAVMHTGGSRHDNCMLEDSRLIYEEMFKLFNK